MFDSAADLIVVLDTRATILDLNRKFEEESGYKKEEVIGKNAFRCGILTKASSAKALLHLEMLLLGKNVPLFEVDGLRKDGRKVPYELRAVPLCREGKIVSIQAILRNISERKQAEQELRENEAKYKTLYESSTDAIMLATMEEGFLGGNPAAIKMFGCRDEAEFTSKTPAELSPEYQPDGTPSRIKAQKMMAIAMKEGAHFFEWKHKRMDGAEFFATVLLTRMELKNRKILQATVRDITQYKRLERSLQEAKEVAEAANRAKSDFLAKMSHEIRTPMTAILGYADLLMDPEISASDHSNYLAVVRRNGEHLLSLINDILDLSKVEAGKLTVQKQPCNLVSTIAGVVSTMQVRAEQRGNRLSIEYAGELPERILTDVNRLSQALINLVGNTIKFTENGRVQIVVKFLPDWREGQPAVQIQVTDSGIGISQEKLGQLFKPFAQADSSTARKYGGTGLGLVITQYITKMLDGELTVQSTPGEGSTFALIVPTGSLEGVKMLEKPSEAEMPPSQDSSRPQQAEDQKPLRGLRILLAEDGIDNQRLVAYLLRKAGAEVQIAETGRQAVDQAQAEPFDIILMDIQMPEMDGYEATRMLRSRGYNRPILALTAHAMVSDREECLKAGCDDYLTKPINQPQLIGTIAKYANRKDEPERSVREQTQGAEKNGQVIKSEFAEDPDLADVLNEFVGGLDLWVSQMRQALANGDHEQLQRQAHQLKGAGGSYGYRTLTDAAKALETAAKDRDRETATLALDRLAGICQAAIRGHDVRTSQRS